MAVPYPKKFPPELLQAAIAAHRFGYGARPGELEGIAADPQGWLMTQIDQPETPPPVLAVLPNSTGIVPDLLDAIQAGPEALQAFRRRLAGMNRREALAHTGTALASTTPFRERLIRFWSNHFAVSDRDPVSFALSHAFEREVIRPRIAGTFIQMLTAVVRHPAVLIQTDNRLSTGPISVAGLKGAPNLIDTLARVILQNYALGPDGDVETRDIVELAKMLTGWSVAGSDEDAPGTFRFRPLWHEQKKKFFFQRYYPEAGVLEAEAALDTIGRQEDTARHLAVSMARYFVTDSPPDELISDMLNGFTGKGNSLLGMAEGMVRSPAAWLPQQAKVKTPTDFVFSTGRLFGWGSAAAPLALAGLSAMGQAPKRFPVLTGWPSDGRAWLSPQHLLERLQWGAAAAREAAPVFHGADMADLGLATLGPLLSPVTHRRLSVTSDPADALALLLASPEFQRR